MLINIFGHTIIIIMTTVNGKIELYIEEFGWY